MKKILFSVVAVVIALVATVLIAPSFIDWNQYRDEIAARTKAATGRDLVIAGDIKIALWPAPAVVARNVRLTNVQGAAAADMVRLNSLEVRVAVGPLLGGNIEVETIRLVDPVVELEVLADGRRNWIFAEAASPGAAPAPGPGAAAGGEADSELPVRLDGIVIENGTLVYRDSKAGTIERVEQVDARFAAATLSGPFESSGRLVARGVPLRFEASVGKVIHERTVPFALIFETTAGGTRAQLNGTLLGLTDAPRLKGQVKVAGNSLAGLIQAAAETGPLPGLLAQGFALEGAVVASATGAEVKDLTAALGETQATGAVALTFGETVNVASKIAIGRIDLDKWLALPAAGPAKAAAAKEEPVGGKGRASVALAPPKRPAKAPAPAAPFALPTHLGGSLNLSVGAVIFRGGAIRELRGNLELAGGELTLSQLAAQFPGSSEVAAFGFLTAAEGQPRFEGEIEATVSDLRRVLAWLDFEPPQVPTDRLRKLTVNSQLRVTRDQVQVPRLDLQLDSSRLTGALTVALRERLAFGVDLTLDRLNVDSYLPVAAAAEPAAKPAAGADKAAPTAPAKAAAPKAAAAPAAGPFAALTALAAFDANFKLLAKALTYRNVPIKDTLIEGTLYNGAIELRQASVADLAGASARLGGTLGGLAGEPATKDFRVDLRVGNLPRLLRLLGVEPPGPAANLGAVEVKGRIDGPLARPSVDLAVKAAGGEVAVAGTLPVGPLEPGFAVKVRASHPDLTQLLARLEVDYRPAGRIGAVEIAADVKGEGSALSFSAIKAKVGTLAVEGGAAVGFGGSRPKVSLDLRTGEIAVERFLPAGKTASILEFPVVPDRRTGVVPAFLRAPAGAAGTAAVHLAAARAGVGEGRWPRDPIDLSALQAIDADVKLKAAAIAFDKYRLDNAELALTVTEGVLRAERLTGTLYGGALAAAAVVRAAPAVRAEAQVRLQGADVRRALQAVAGKDLAAGGLDVEAKLTAGGGSVAELISALDGSGSLSLRQLDVKAGADGTPLAAALGLVASLNQLGGALGGERRGGGLADITGSFRVERGVARSQDLRMVSNLGTAEAQGSVDLANWLIDVKGELRLAQNLLTQLLAQRTNAPQVLPLEIKGALDAPAVKLGTGQGVGGLPIPGVDKLLQKKGVGEVLQQILPGQVQPPQPQPTQPSTSQAPAEPKKLRPEDVLRQILRGGR